MRQNSTIHSYLQAFVNYQEDNLAQLLPIAKFAYNNAKNASTKHIPFEFNYDYHSYVSYKRDVNPRSQSKSADKLATELKELMIVSRENFQYA